MKVADIKIRRYPQPIRGIITEEGIQWIALAENVVDYVLDGYMFINKQYIQTVKERPHDSLHSKILLHKYRKTDFSGLDSYSSMLNALQEKGLLIAVGRNNQQSFLVGHIESVGMTSFELAPIDTNLTKLPKTKIAYSTIRYLSIMSDYLNSISDFINPQHRH